MDPNLTKLFLMQAKEALKDEFPELLKLQAVSTSVALDEGKEVHHQQEYYAKMKEEEGNAGFSPVLKTEDAKKGSFQVYDSGCRGLVFIGIRHEIDPVPFVRRAMQLMTAEEGQPKLKWPRETVIERIIPVQRTCFATIPKLLETVKPMVEEHLSEQKQPITWGIVTHHRNNKEINRKVVIDTVAALVPAKHPVNLSNPAITIIVEVIKSTCCITLTTDYHSLAKYNPSVHLQPKTDPTTEKKPDEAIEQ